MNETAGYSVAELEALLERPAIRQHRRRPRRAHTAVRVLMAALALATAAAVAVLLLVPMTPPAAPGPPRYYDWPGGAPRGITLSGLQAYLFGPPNVTMMEKQMLAARRYWHANTIRLQVIQDKLVGEDGNRYRPLYGRYVRELVTFGLRHHLTVVLNAQTEISTGWATDEPMPTRATFAFWARVIRWYRNRPGVAFDLFNEPRHSDWTTWQADMQGLITYIRRHGARNWIWVDGERWGSTLAGVPLLHDPARRLAYTYHHPGAPWQYQNTPTADTWDRAFGDLAARGLPVVDGEFAAFTGSYDWARPSQTVRQYLAYLAAHHIGLLGWTLTPGALNSTGSYASASTEPQGDGRLVKAWFAQQARTQR